MKKYLNLSGKSGVTEYEIGDDYVKVCFGGGVVYKYSVKSAGQSEVDELKSLAIKGLGLNTFINKYVKYLYESKSRK